MSAAARILERLHGVKQTAPDRWIACCPAHEDRSPSLSIRETDDGRVLLYCFGGCETVDVLTALGLGLSDLFDKPLTRTALAPIRSRLPARELLELVSHEVGVAVILLTAVVEHQGISELAWERLATAARRIGHARDSMHGN